MKLSKDEPGQFLDETPYAHCLEVHKERKVGCQCNRIKLNEVIRKSCRFLYVMKLVLRKNNYFCWADGRCFSMYSMVGKFQLSFPKENILFIFGLHFCQQPSLVWRFCTQANLFQLILIGRHFLSSVKINRRVTASFLVLLQKQQKQQ